MSVGSDRVKVPDVLQGPPAGKAIAGGFTAIHSQPALIILYLIFSIVLTWLPFLVKNIDLDIVLLVGTILVLLFIALAGLFLHAGFMGSIEVILLGKGWIPAAVLECGKLYFIRFLIILLLFLLASIALSLPVSFLLPKMFQNIEDMESVLAQVKIMVITLILIKSLRCALYSLAIVFLAFAFSCVVIDNLRSIDAILRGLRIILANKLRFLSIWVILAVPLPLIGFLAAYLLPESRL